MFSSKSRHIIYLQLLLLSYTSTYDLDAKHCTASCRIGIDGIQKYDMTLRQCIRKSRYLYFHDPTTFKCVYVNNLTCSNNLYTFPDKRTCEFLCEDCKQVDKDIKNKNKCEQPYAAIDCVKGQKPKDHVYFDKFSGTCQEMHNSCGNIWKNQFDTVEKCMSHCRSIAQNVILAKYFGSTSTTTNTLVSSGTTSITTTSLPITTIVEYLTEFTGLVNAEVTYLPLQTFRPLNNLDTEVVNY